VAHALDLRIPEGLDEQAAVAGDLALGVDRSTVRGLLDDVSGEDFAEQHGRAPWMALHARSACANLEG